MTNFDVSRENVKIIGRTCYRDGVRWCGLSGSGIGFTFTGTRAVIHFQGDDSTTGNSTEGKARVAIYRDDVRICDFMMEEPEKEITVFQSSGQETTEIRVVKLSECPMSLVGISGIEADTVDGIHPSKEKDLKIEFVGDSITCGFGVDREDPDTPFETGTEDVTKAYAYRTAELLGADYSMVSYSGYGIISGYTENDEKQSEQCVPLYYEKTGFSYGKLDWKIQDIPWNFREFVPDMVVILLGTNDDSYCQDDKDRQKDFEENYGMFLEMVRKNNPGAEILCMLGIMKDRPYPFIQSAVEKYKHDSKDNKVHTLRLPLQRPEDGLVSCSHPTERTHGAAAKRVAEEIQSILGEKSLDRQK